LGLMATRVMASRRFGRLVEAALLETPF
jgi:hypothetical protein